MQCVCACVCVCACEDFFKRYEFNWYDKKQLDFLDKRESMKDQSKAKPYLTRA